MGLISERKSKLWISYFLVITLLGGHGFAISQEVAQPPKGKTFEDLEFSGGVQFYGKGLSLKDREENSSKIYFKIGHYGDINAKKKYEEAYELYKKKNDPEGALRIIERYGSPTRNFGWGNLYVMIKESQGKLHEALYIMDAITTRVGRFYKVFKKSNALEKAPISVREQVKKSYANFLIMRGELSYRTKKWKIMCDSYGEYVDSFSEISKEDLAQSFINLGVCSYYLGRYKDMANFSTKAISFSKNRGLVEEGKELVGVYYNAAIAYAKMGDLDNAIKWLEVPLEVSPDKFLSKIKNEEDFSSVLEEERFKEFLRKYRRR